MILAKFNFTDTKPVTTALDPNAHLSESQIPRTTSETVQMHNIPYCQATGSLIYLIAGMRPDIAFATLYICQFNANLGWAHWEAVKQIYHYLVGTKGWMLTLSMQTHGLVGYADADGATQEHHHAITGFMFLIDRGAILWGSSMYVTATHATKEAIWLQCLISKMFHPLCHPTILYSNNQSAIVLTKDSSFHA